MSIEANLQNIQRRITQAADRAGRDSRDVKLVAVSKTIGLEKINTLMASLADFCYG